MSVSLTERKTHWWKKERTEDTKVMPEHVSVHVNTHVTLRVQCEDVTRRTEGGHCDISLFVTFLSPGTLQHKYFWILWLWNWTVTGQRWLCASGLLLLKKMDVFQDYLCYSELSVLQTKKMRINIGQYWTDYQCGRLLRPIFSIFSDYWSMYFLIAD